MFVFLEQVAASAGALEECTWQSAVAMRNAQLLGCFILPSRVLVFL